MLTTVLLSGGNGCLRHPGASINYWQPALRLRQHLWLGKPDILAMSPLAPERAGTCYIEKKTLNALHKMRLLPVTLVNNLYNPKHKESEVYTSTKNH